MLEIHCIALVMYMEAQTQSIYTKRLVASVSIERAKQEDTTICKSIKKRGGYSWMWDRKFTKVKNHHLVKLYPLAAQELQNPTITGRYFFNECTLGKRWNTPYRIIRSEKLCFY